MKELVILSGKGGTGKTSLTAEFAAISNSRVLCDADVDAADLHLLMAPEIKLRADFKGGGLAFINQDKCIECRECIELCKFDAISDDFIVSEIDCEGCGVCVDLCPEKAIEFPIQTCGEWYISETRFGPMAHAILGIAQENSGKLVALVRQEARKLAEKKGMNLILTDGPPGVGCPVIASIGGATAILIVTEPTVSGIHDMKRAIELAAHFKVPAMVCVNKYDLNPDQAKNIENLVEKQNLTFLGNIPFDPVFTKSMVQGKTIVEYEKDSSTLQVIKNIWEKIMGSHEMNSIN
ncbi:MAG: P-loop NTPase [Desulfobacterales bacterium]|jgi:MinD superfamily P-loop ATPase|nr:P-loop NTPase [Desulfobacteraceae bacterium]MBT4365378.1 P-loop NTPase [Desulfobacteraceae bacterium]MBT7087126.1 P-loop NTPase [Desulfobacterales bacterium]MBT7697766.1 P-loop NTPase [Desulfobacterales bacterium]